MPTMTPAEFSAWCTERASRMLHGFTRATEAAQKDVRDAAERNSLGPLSSAHLRALGHPYAKRHGRPLLDPAIINRQTGEFAASWQAPPVEERGDALVGIVYNSDPKARFLEGGTDRMFARPVHLRALEEAEPLIERHYDDAFRDVFEG